MSTRKVGVIQSAYIPWKGYFDIINMSDVFVFYDDIQFTKQDWRTRNQIKTSQGLKWLTVPCGTRLDRLICDVRIETSHWQQKHWRSISQNYRRAAHYGENRAWLEPLYTEREWTNLSELNQTFTRTISRDVLGSTTEFRDSREFGLPEGSRREDRLIELLVRLQATHLITGPAARDYLYGEALQKMHDRGVEAIWMDYSGYPEYRQLYPPFEHPVSIVDLLMNEGPEATRYMLSFGRGKRGAE